MLNSSKQNILKLILPLNLTFDIFVVEIISKKLVVQVSWG
jgi:hypothetical protein